jgi:formate dehydrogenase assembly factor FdhD
VTSSIITVPIRKIEGATATTEQDLLAVEEPLEIVVNGRNLAVIMLWNPSVARFSTGRVRSFRPT